MIEFSDVIRKQKKVAMILMCRMFDSNEKGTNTSKAQCESVAGKVKRAKKIREKQLK